MTSALVNSLNAIHKALIELDETVAVAESVTAGNLQAAFSLADDAMSFFQGGITAYNLGQKTRHLRIDPIAGQNCNCVSDAIARQMAKRAAKIFSADWGIGITGYAAPVPQWEVDNILFAYVSFVFRGQVVYENKLDTPKMDMKKVQDSYVREVLKEFAALLLQRIREAKQLKEEPHNTSGG